MPASVPQQPREDVDLDEVLHYLPDLTLLVEKKVLGWGIRLGRAVLLLMTSVHASLGPVGARFNTHFRKKKMVIILRVERKTNMVARKGSIHTFSAFSKVQTWR